jgi:4-hydroxy-4-methyl-2-oxoglutarate aldolase
MMTGKDRVEVTDINVPVSIGNVQVCPDDIVVCDDTGVVIVPKGNTSEVLKTALQIDAAEQKILGLLDQGLSLKEARKELGYHNLQTKK